MRVSKSQSVLMATITSRDLVRGLFDAVIDEVQVSIPFDPEWENGTGYFNFAVSAKAEGIVKSVDPAGRHILFMPSHVEGKYDVLFQRHTNTNLVCAHMAQADRDWSGGKRVDPFEAEYPDNPELAALTRAYLCTVGMRAVNSAAP